MFWWFILIPGLKKVIYFLKLKVKWTQKEKFFIKKNTLYHWLVAFLVHTDLYWLVCPDHLNCELKIPLNVFKEDLAPYLIWTCFFRDSSKSWITVCPFFSSLWPDCQEEARTHQEQAQSEERQEATKKIMMMMNSSRKTNKCEKTSNNQWRRTQRLFICHLVSSASLLERPHVLRKLKCCVWLAPELLSVLS